MWNWSLCYPVDIAMGYAGSIKLGNKMYKLVIMVRVKPSKIREPWNEQDFWIVDGKSDQLRPYRLLIKEFNGHELAY